MTQELVCQRTCGPTAYPWGKLSCAQHVGRRRTQEDRFSVCPQLRADDEKSVFIGVWDGTVGDFASDQVMSLVLPHTLGSAGWREYAGRAAPAHEGDAQQMLAAAAAEGYARADAELLEMCARERNNYASTTSVTALITGGVLTVAHLGDSKIALGSVDGAGRLRGQSLTTDHKPDTDAERARIEGAGGSVEYLTDSHSKPFIRGGDFLPRKAQGDKPMQLQYSRAFGGKDLKPFGLSAAPDVAQLVLQPQHRLLVLATDGLWDVCSPADAVAIGMHACQAGEDPAQALVSFALDEQNGSDNVTVVVLELAAM
jgi:serine/threonine protein phosphatase PrpC